MTHKKEFLISELHRFVRENGRVPKQLDMDAAGNGYPSVQTYQRCFGTWNNALEAARLKINQKHHVGTLDGTETCFNCHKRADEIIGFISWNYNKSNNKRHCNKCGNGKGIFHHKQGILDINSKVGRGRAGEITIIKALKIGDEFDCNRISCGYKIDMYNEEYGKINVKTSVLNNKYNKWAFGFRAEKVANTYICIGMSSNTKQVEHVWIVPNERRIRELTSFKILNGKLALKNHEKYEVNPKIYDDAWQDMLLNYTDGKCKVFGKKDKCD